MVKSQDTNTAVLGERGYYTASHSAQVREQASVSSHSSVSVSGNKRRANDTKKVYPDEMRYLHSRAKLRSPRRMHPEYMFFAKVAFVCSTFCAVMIIMIAAHLRVASNDRAIQSLTIGIQQAEADQQSLNNTLYQEQNPQHIAAEAAKLKMVQSTAQKNVSLALGIGQAPLTPQEEIAQAQ